MKAWIESDYIILIVLIDDFVGTFVWRKYNFCDEWTIHVLFN